MLKPTQQISQRSYLHKCVAQTVFNVVRGLGHMCVLLPCFVLLWLLCGGLAAAAGPSEGHFRPPLTHIVALRALTPAFWTRKVLETCVLGYLMR